MPKFEGKNLILYAILKSYIGTGGKCRQVKPREKAKRDEEEEDNKTNKKKKK